MARDVLKTANYCAELREECLAEKKSFVFETVFSAVDRLVHANILSVNLSRFNVGTGHGQKREWEVGNKSPYDDLDAKMSGTRLSM